MHPSYTWLITNKTDGILWVEINRPEKRNALSMEVLAEIQQAFEDNAGDDLLKAAVLRGSGDKSFAAGGDLRQLDAVRSQEGAEIMSDTARAALDAILAPFGANPVMKVDGAFAEKHGMGILEYLSL